MKKVVLGRRFIASTLTVAMTSTAFVGTVSASQTEDAAELFESSAYINTDEFVDFDYAFEGVEGEYGGDNSFNGLNASKAGAPGTPCYWSSGGNFTVEYQTTREYTNNYVVSTGGRSGVIYVGEIEDVQAIDTVALRGSSSGGNSTYNVYAMSTEGLDFNSMPNFSSAVLIASGVMPAAAAGWHTLVADTQAQMADFDASGTMGIFVQITASGGANYDGMRFTMKNLYGVNGLSASAGDGEVTLTWGKPISDRVENVTVICYEGSTAVDTVTVPAADETYTFTGLTNGTMYTFTVAPEDGSLADPVTVNAMPYVFEELEAVYGVQEKDSIVISWQVPAGVLYSVIKVYDENHNLLETLTGDAQDCFITVEDNVTGEYTYYVEVQDGRGNSAEKEVTVSYNEYVPEGPSIRDFTYLPGVAYDGGYTEDTENEVITLKGKSGDIAVSGNSDQSFDYLYIPLSHSDLREDGDTISISAKFEKFPTQINQTSQFKNIKAGLMYRNEKNGSSFSQGSASSVNLFVSPATTDLATDPYRLMFSYREMKTNPQQIQNVNMMPTEYSYIMLEGVKSGNDLVFNFLYSNDGNVWLNSGQTYTEVGALNYDTGYYGMFLIGKETEVSAAFGDIKINGIPVNFEAPKAHDVTRVDTYVADGGVKFDWVAPQSNDKIIVSYGDEELELPAGTKGCELTGLNNNTTINVTIKTRSTESEGVVIPVKPLELMEVKAATPTVTKQYIQVDWQLPQYPNRTIINEIDATVLKDGEEVYSESMSGTAVSFSTNNKITLEIDTDYTVIITTKDILGNERSTEVSGRYNYDGSPFAVAGDKKIVFNWTEDYSLYNRYDSLNFYIGGSLMTSAAMTDKRAAIPYLANGEDYAISIKGVKNGVETDLNDTTVIRPVGDISFSAEGIGGATAIASNDNGILTLRVTGGSDIWSSPDKFAYYCVKVTGDISMAIRIDAYGSNPDAWSRQGLMIRDNLEGDSRFVGAGVLPNSTELAYGVAREARAIAGETAVRESIFGAVYQGGYLRMTKKGNYIYTDVSTDGINWVDRTQNQMAFENDTFYIGITKAKDDTDGIKVSDIIIDGQSIYSPNPVENLKLDGATDGGAVISWDEPDGDLDLYNGYSVAWYDESGSKNEVILGKDQTNYTITGLENNKTYTVDVRSLYNDTKNSTPRSIEVEPYSMADAGAPAINIDGDATINKGGTKSFDLVLDKKYPLKSLEINLDLSSGLTLKSFDKDSSVTDFDVEKKGNTITFTSKTGKAEYIDTLGTLKISAANSVSSAQTLEVSGKAEYYNEYQNSAEPSKIVTIPEKKITLSISTQSGNSGGGGGGGGGSSSPSIQPDGSVTPNLSGNPQKYFGEEIVPNVPESKPVESNAIFIDEDKISSWAIEAVKELYRTGAVSGIGYDDKVAFEPQGDVTREAFVKMLIGAIGNSDNTETCDFTDVNENDWFYPYIAEAYKMGVVVGRDDGSFGVGEKISRQDMAVMLVRAMEAYGINKDTVNTPVTFSDGDEIADYAADAVSLVQQTGIMLGMDDDKFEPNSTATREMAATVIYRIITSS